MACVEETIEGIFISHILTGLNFLMSKHEKKKKNYSDNSGLFYQNIDWYSFKVIIFFK